MAEESVVDFWHNEPAINKVKGHIDDFFHDVMRDQHGIELEDKQMDEIMDSVMQVARHRNQNR